MEDVVLNPVPNSKRKAGTLVEGPSDGDSAAGSSELETTTKGQSATDENPAKVRIIMSQEWIDAVLATEIKPLPFKERHLRDPKLAAIFRSHEESRARHAGYKAWLRSELETKGYIEVGDDYDERCDLYYAVQKAAFYGNKEEEDAAMAKLADLRRA